MAKIRVSIAHKVCGFKTELVTKKPDHFTPSSGTFICSGCESKLWYRISKARNGIKGQVNVETKAIQMSDIMEDLLKEQMEEAVKEHENATQSN